MQRIGSIGSRPCENVRERRNHRIVFSIAFFGQPPSGLLVLRLKKSRRTFYAQIERGSFRTASVDCCRNPEVGALAAFSALRWSPFRPFCAVARSVRPQAWQCREPSRAHLRNECETLRAGTSSSSAPRFQRRAVFPSSPVQRRTSRHCRPLRSIGRRTTRALYRSRRR